LLAAFFELLAFFVVALLRAFLAAGAALLLAAVVDDEEAVVDGAEVAAAAFPLDDFALDFDAPPAAFFFGAAAFFFGLLALPADFGLADALDFGLAAGLAFLAPVDAFFLLALAAVEAVVAAAVAVGAFVVVAGLLAAAVVLAAFFAGAFFVGEAERFRLLAPLADFVLLDDRAFFVLVPLAFLLPLGVFDRLRDLGFDDVLLAVVFFLPAADEPFFDVDDAANLKLPLAPTPFVCFNELFFVPARNADLRC